MSPTLVVAFDPARARPLDASVRRRMERRFRADFSEVRIHVCPVAAAAANALGADAFTAGRDIFFAAGRYVPDTAEGQCLLAHELAHVLQQPSRTAQGMFRLGAADDPQEQRAMELAHEALTAGRTTPVLHDSERVVRRSVVVDDKSARIELDFAGASPNTFVLTEPTENIPGKVEQKTSIMLHLTRNFLPGATQNIGAWNATGRVGVEFEPISDGLELRTWHFGFIQFMEVKELNLFYAGRIPSDGGIHLPVHKALRATFGRDAAGKSEVNPPWTTADTRGDTAIKRRGIAERRTEDHPQLTIPTDLHNRKTLYRNFLFRVTDSRKFVVIFAVQEPFPTFAFRHLAHFEIDLVYDFDVTWKPAGGEITPLVTRRPEAQLKFGPVIPGAPSSPKVLLPFLENPTDAQRVGTAELTGAIRSSIEAAGRPDAKTWVGTPPSNFFP